MFLLKLNGGLKTMLWKAWRYDSRKLWFQYISILPALSPNMKLQSKWFRVNKHIDSDNGWANWLLDCGDSKDNHFKRSLVSMSARGSADDVQEENRESASLSAFGLLSLLAWLCGNRRDGLKLHEAQRCLFAFLNATIPKITINDIPWRQFLDAITLDCAHDPTHRPCVHVQQILKELTGSTTVHMINVLAFMMKLAQVCLCVRDLANIVMHGLVQTIEDEWDSHNYSKDAVRDAELLEGTKKRRWVDDDFREGVRNRASRKRASSNLVAQCVVGDGIAFKTEDIRILCSYACACWRHWSSVDNLVLSMASDAGDFGYPRESTMLYLLSDGYIASWGAPMVQLFLIIPKK